jgi:hypothetical protein
MTRQDLISFRITKKWTDARIKFLEEQIETVGRLNSILSDMPKGSRKVQDNEAESLVKLLDQIQALKDEIENKAINMEINLKEQLNELSDKKGLLLYHHYILGDSIKDIAKKVIYNDVKYTYTLKDEALKEFDKIHEKKGRITN